MDLVLSNIGVMVPLQGTILILTPPFSPVAATCPQGQAWRLCPHQDSLPASCSGHTPAPVCTTAPAPLNILYLSLNLYVFLHLHLYVLLHLHLCAPLLMYMHLYLPLHLHIFVPL